MEKFEKWSFLQGDTLNKQKKAYVPFEFSESSL